MCGRYSLKSSPSKIAEEFNLPENETEKLKPRYNIAPSQPVAALIREQTTKLDFLNWGLIPSWGKDPSAGALDGYHGLGNYSPNPAFSFISYFVRQATNFLRALINV
jgi:putative SOS response-associated peptidase YedK